MQGAGELILTLELMLPADAAPPAGTKWAGRARGLRLAWYDTADFSLALDGLAFVHTIVSADGGARPPWRLDRFRPAGPAAAWAPGSPDMAVAEGDDSGIVLASAGHARIGILAPIAWLQARQRILRVGPDGVTGGFTDGLIHGAATARPVRLLRLAGPPDAVMAVAEAWGAGVSDMTLSALALSLVRPNLPPRRVGAPIVAANLGVGAAFGHIVGHLADVIIGLAPRIALGTGPEAVHQMRVATRRLRSALGVFGKIVRCPELAPVKADARHLAAMLGPARDWDVFLAGTGAAVAAALPDDAAVARLLAAAKRRRHSAYTTLRDYLDGPLFRRQCLRLAAIVALQPWEDEVPHGAVDLVGFAARALKKRHGQILAAGNGADGDGIAGLAIPALHGLRLQAKRLRYAAEFLAPLYPERAIGKYLRRLADLQEALGHLNDSSVAASLMGELSRAGGLGYGGGVVRGYVAGTAGDARTEIVHAWKRFRKLDAKALFVAAKAST